ncbi:MAG: 2,3-bisphosphoglycerate-independent phosphoglycerate mutase [Cytophagales bacterium]|nr:2,3-bisphosphoglycerate-independent phosphoglycerate mutase [Bernardetiaceae bacterium]MDW8205453.1 2,3-bisphosphoglycerate-independent phosphoglycerate mutase [Cytophagales bacterium]
MNKHVILIILDGWGIAVNKSASAIDAADTPFMDSIWSRYPHSKLEASGLAVGLPEGQMGNSEVGHMNIGAGRVVNQTLVKLNKAVADGSMQENPVLLQAFQYAKNNRKKVHFIGLVSDGGIHSHINHLKALTAAAHRYGLSDVYIHAFTDGRDTDPQSGLGFVEELEAHLKSTTGAIASVTGRYYAMDRDKRWERIKLAYDAMVRGIGATFASAVEGIRASYAAGVTDEFIQPIVCTDTNGQPLATIAEGDVVLCFNFRTDRGREITMALTQQAFPEQGMQPLPLHYLTMTRYDDTFKGVQVMYEDDNMQNTLGEVLAAAGKTQIRIAETEKYPHVTFFFSGGREEPFAGEKRILCPSPKVATYDLQPEMSAADIRDAIIPELQARSADFICLNFANPDMVGHTGVFEAAVKACETVDACTQKVVEAALANGYTALIIADHGNADIMINPDGTPNTAHTTNLVPCILVDEELAGKIRLQNGKLADVAPTILKLMGIAQPAEMDGVPLF